MKLPPIIIAFLFFIAIISSHFVLSSAANARQSGDFETAIASKKRAVSEVARAVQRALQYDSWCQSGLGCNSKCSYHSCDVAGKHEELTCQKTLVPKPCDCKASIARDLLLREMKLNPIVRQDSCDKEALCENYSTPGSRGVNYKQPVFRTPPNTIRSEGDNKPIIVLETELRRDLCALKTIEQTIVTEFKNNNVTSALYAGTTNGAFMIFPGAPFCRDHNSDDPIVACNNYDPTERPWYITASTGPRDIVFMFDDKVEDSSPLHKSMVETLDQLDARDAVALRLFTEDKVLPIKTNGTLFATGTVKNELKSELKTKTVGRSGRSDVRMALEDAFEVLNKAKSDASVATSNCERYIVLMIGSEDSCFENCSSNSDCTCISELKVLIKENQKKFERSVSLVVFTDTKSEMSLTQISNMESLGRTLACPSGIWSRVVDTDTEQTAMLAFRKFGAFLLYDDESSEDKIFSSEIYQGAGGLGEMFTLAVPVYDQATQGLVAVAGADITISELGETLTEDEAKEEVKVFSGASRKCFENVRDVEKEKCKADSLRSNLPNSAICPEPMIDSTCVKFPNSDTVFYRSSKKKTYSEAVAACNAQNYAELAVIDTNAKNTFFTSIADADGTWIGLTGKASDGILRWPSNSSSDLRGKEVEYNQTAFNIEDWVTELRGQSFTDVCVSADRRGVSGNWNILPCSRQLSYVCELKTTTGTECEEGTNATIYTQECTSKQAGARACDNSDQIEKANPFCNQTGKAKTEAERYCCGELKNTTQGASPTPVESPGGTPVALIGGIAGGAVVFVIFLIVILMWRRNRNNSKNSTPKLEPRDSRDSFTPQDFASADTESVFTLNQNRPYANKADV